LRGIRTEVLFVEGEHPSHVRLGLRPPAQRPVGFGHLAKNTEIAVTPGIEVRFRFRQVSRRTRDEFLVPVRVVELAKLDVLGRDLIEVRGAHFGPGRRDEPKI
jgi:hypothetical protein